MGSISLKTHRSDLAKELAQFQQTGPELRSCLRKLRAARDTLWATAGLQASTQVNSLPTSAPQWQWKRVFLGKTPPAKADSWGTKTQSQISDHTEVPHIVLNLSPQNSLCRRGKHDLSEGPASDLLRPSPMTALSHRPFTLPWSHRELHKATLSGGHYSPALEGLTVLLGKWEPQTHSTKG